MKRISLVALLFLTACGSVTVEDYAGRTPALDIREYFNGDIDAVGMLIDRNGDADPRFHVKMHGKFDKNQGVLKEDFVYSNGKTQHREWVFHFTDDNHFTATAADVPGVATGAQFGNAANMKYTLHIADKDVDVSVDDWVYAIDDHTVLNRSEMRKFGLSVGELVISFHKR